MRAARLPAPFGRLIDRNHRVSFTFEGRAFSGFAGDTIASALAAEGQWMLSRSFKYHRPRGLVSAAGLEANTLVQVGLEPNVHADKRLIEPGLGVSAVNTFGGLALDAGRVIEKISRFMPVGFYYRAFYKPRVSWKVWEPVIRHLAGLGRVDPHTPHGRYDKAYLFADVAVIGGGVAGLTAALAAAEAGAEVLLVEDAPVLGGALTYARPDTQAPGADTLAARVEADSRITVLTDACCQGLFADNWLSVTQGNRLNKVRAKSVVIATGAHEVPAIFRGNDLPGIMLGSAAQRLMRLWAVQPGRRAVVLAANDEAYGVALDLLDAGVEIASVADLRADPGTTPRIEAVRARGVGIHPGTTIAEAEGRENHVAAVRFAPVTGPGTFGAVGDPVACDLVCVSVGFGSHTALLTQGGAQVLPDPQTFLPRLQTTPPGLYAAGSVRGVWAAEAVLRDGHRAGLAAAAHAGLAVGAVPDASPADDTGLTWPHPVFPHPKGKEFIDFDEDLQVHDIVEAAALGWDHIQLLKRFSTAGMGPTQGKLTNALVQSVLGRVTNRPAPSVGTVTIRPPIVGEKIGHLAGRSFEVTRLTAMHHRHVALGATMMVAGAWMRPAHYGPTLDVAVAREVAAARTQAALIDVSTLGKLEVRGPDAARFLERIHTWTYDKLAVGRVRYVLTLDETGVIIDDGVAARLHERHFYVTATTGGVDRVFRLMQFFNTQWRMRVDIANVTAAYAGVNVLGPRSREILAAVGTDIDLAPEAFPYLGVREGTVGGIPVRVMRIGFGGELGYEVHAPSSQGGELWDRIVAEGRPRGLLPVGIEAQRVLRLEKGHIIVGQDTDSLTHPLEAGMTWAIGRKKADFLGKAALDVLEAKPQVRRLVGFVLDPAAAVVPKENHLVIENGEIAGRVTSLARSPTLGTVIGLAYVPPARAEVGQEFTIRADGGAMVSARVVPLPFYDPDNARQEM